MSDDWLKIDAARRYAGGCSRKVLYRAAKAGHLRVGRIGSGRNMVFRKEWIDEWLSRSGTDDAGEFKAR